LHSTSDVSGGGGGDGGGGGGGGNGGGGGGGGGSSSSGGGGGGSSSSGGGICMDDDLDSDTEAAVGATQDTLLKELLCYQIVVSCHLHMGSQDNLFAIKGLSFLFGGCNILLDEPSDMLGFLSYMKLDVVRGLRLAMCLASNNIARDL
jgi:hypothetical protein